MHGHSRKNQVFMYGCDSSGTNEDEAQSGGRKRRHIEAFINERLFPWLMSKKAPGKFSFQGCKFHIRRCKEATGRVVMWRQMRIMNSFTMEATFSGTAISKEEGRHFNIEDFQEMGRVFGETILEYQHTKENQEKKTDAIVDITRAVTHQILEVRGMVAPELLDMMENNEDNGSKVTQVLLQLLSGEKSTKPKEKRAVDVNQLMNNLSAETIQGCFQILEQLNATEELLESDSSDSDSESEPELPRMPEPKKKKKKKSRKQRDKERIHKQDKGETKAVSALPAIHSAEFPREKKKQTPSINKCVKAIKGHPLFVSKYEGRHNNGIPWAAEERSNERAAKRVAEMRRRMEQEKQREAALYFDDFHDNVEMAMNLGSANIAETLMGLRFKTSYQHADDEIEKDQVNSSRISTKDAVRLLEVLSTDSNVTSESDDEEADDGTDANDRRKVAIHNPYALMNYGININGPGNQFNLAPAPSSTQMLATSKPKKTVMVVRPSPSSIPPQSRLMNVNLIAGRRAGSTSETTLASNSTKVSSDPRF